MPQLRHDVRTVLGVGLAKQIDAVGRVCDSVGLHRLLKQQHCAAELEFVPVVQLLHPHGGPVDQRSIGTVPVADDEQALAEMDGGVLTRDLRVADADVVATAAAQRDQFRPDLKASRPGRRR